MGSQRAGKSTHAKLRQQASIEDLNLKAGRGVDRPLVSSLSDSEWINKHLNVLLTGPTGVGKNYLACALAQKACVDGHTVVYHCTSRLFEQLSIARAFGAYPRFLNALFKTYAKSQLTGTLSFPQVTAVINLRES